jgi:hypothetical protein
MNTPKQAFLTDKEPAEIKRGNRHIGFKVERCGRPSERLTRKQLQHAMNICTFDMAKQGRIWRWKCPTHNQTALTYHFAADGVHVFCEACGLTNHFELVNFDGRETDDGEE